MGDKLDIKESLLFLVVVFSTFNLIPGLFQMNFIGSFLGKNLAFYPIVLSVIYFCYEYKNGRCGYCITDKWKYIFLYLFVYLAFDFISLLHGLYIYPYYDEIYLGPRDQIDKLLLIQKYLHVIGLSLSEEALFKIWIFARPIKGFIVESIWFFMVPLIVFMLYKKDIDRGNLVLCKAVVISVIFVSLYNILDILYLSGNRVGENILISINPWIHDIEGNDTWWPPLLWPGQLRSLFAEPSYYGIFSAFAMPWLWYSILRTEEKRKKFLLFFLLFIFTLGLFLTKARTSNALFIGELFLLLSFSLWYHQKSFFYNTVKILLISLFSFFLAVLFIEHISSIESQLDKMPIAKSTTESVGTYLDDNIASLSSSTKRSNLSRYSILKANIAIGKDYPILGIGRGLRNAYIPDYLPDEAFDGDEIQRWIHDQKTKGILKSGFPELGEYSTKFAETGVIGLIIFLFPPVYLVINLFKNVKDKTLSRDKRERIIFFLLSLAGTMASGFGDSFNITIYYWILMGIGFALKFQIMKE